MISGGINRSRSMALLVVVLLLTLSGHGGERPRDLSVPQPFDRLWPLHEKLPPPQPGEWLAEHRESGQTYRDFLRSKPIRPTATRRVLYVQPLGDFTATQRKIIDLTAEYMEVYFGLPVTIQKSIGLETIPSSARRKHPRWGMDQVLTTHVLEKVLYPTLPADAMARIAFTASDLWPGEGWNFVFGQASLNRRVGVWSVYRNGDPEAGDEAFRLCLLRTIKIATHETGHMFSMQHCIFYRCNMAGANHLDEADRHPLWLCPLCLAKLCWATGVEPADRFRRLSDFCARQGLDKEQAFFRRSLELIEKP